MQAIQNEIQKLEWQNDKGMELSKEGQFITLLVALDCLCDVVKEMSDSLDHNLGIICHYMGER